MNLHQRVGKAVKLFLQIHFVPCSDEVFPLLVFLLRLLFCLGVCVRVFVLSSLVLLLVWVVAPNIDGSFATASYCPADFLVFTCSFS